MAKERSVTEAVTLSCETINDLDNGIFGMLVDKEIGLASNDLLDRGEEDGKPRKVVIELELAYHKGIIVTTPRVQAKLPPRQSNSTGMKSRMAAKGQTELLFQAANYENPDQGTFAGGEIPND